MVAMAGVALHTSVQTRVCCTMAKSITYAMDYPI
jgi:hypothetical protein